MTVLAEMEKSRFSSKGATGMRGHSLNASKTAKAQGWRQRGYSPGQDGEYTSNSALNATQNSFLEQRHSQLLS